MDAGSLLLGLALIVVVAAFVLRPLVERRTHGGKTRVSGATSGLEELLKQRDTIYVAIRELDFDFRLGKVSEEDYRPQRERLALQGVAVLKQLDALSPNGAAAVEDEIEAEIARRRRKRAKPSSRKARAGQAQDDEIEAQIRALRQKAPASSCPRCGSATLPEDRFCRNCGATLGSQGASISATGV